MPLLFVLLLASCSAVNDTAVLNDNTGLTKMTQPEENDVTLANDEALAIASSLIDETLGIFEEVYYYVEEKNLTNDELFNALQPASSYATDNFIETFLFQPGYSCTDSHCPSPENMFLSLARGFRTTVDVISPEQFQVSALYPSFRLREYEDSNYRTNDLIQSQKYTFTLVQQDDSWKLDDLQFSEEDMNIYQREVGEYVKKHDYDFAEVVSAEERYLIDRNEVIYTFKENDSDYTFQLVARTGFISSSAGLDYSRYDLSYLEDEEIIERENLTPYLDYFADMSVYADEIDVSSFESQNLLNRLNRADETWIDPPYYEDEREAITALHKEYYDIVYQTFEFLINKHPDQAQAINDYFDTLFGEMSAYFHQYGISYQFVHGENIVYLGDSMWIHRNIAYTLLYYQNDF